MSERHPGHTLVVGGTGMLAPMTRALLERGWRVSSVSRRATASALDHRDGDFAGYGCDYRDRDGFGRVLAAIMAERGEVDLAVLWIHPIAPNAPRQAAETTMRASRPLRLIHVLGSAAGDPARPERLAQLRRQITDGLERVHYRQAILGFVVEATCSRWLTDQEISDGVLRAVDGDGDPTIVGTVSPWSARP